MKTELPLVLASTSPRRKQLLAEHGFQFTAVSPDDTAEDERLPDETPPQYVCRLAEQKAKNVAGRVARGFVIGCDTVAVCNGEVFGKPADRQDAKRMLTQLCRYEHTVISGLCVIQKKDDRETMHTCCVTTTLVMQPINDDVLEKYLDTEKWKSKAGAFGYQDGNDWLRIISGSETNVVGLPMEMLKHILFSDK